MTEEQQRYGATRMVVPAATGRRRGRVAVAGGLAVALAVGGGGVALHDRFGGGGSAVASGPAATADGSAFGGGFGSGGFGGLGSSGAGTYGGGYGTGSGSTYGTGTAASRSATAAESVGVVDIDTVLDYGSGAAAGTGIVLTADGEILTNHHVVAGATSITVTVVSTGREYKATVVGTDATDDVAVLRLAGAAGLTTATLGSSGQVAVGDDVVAVGNAGGTGGTPTAAEGSVTALGRSITASDESGTDPEQLTGLIEVDAAIEAGDSGGPLFEDGAVVGIDTAASTGPGATTGYAIPISTALALADRITDGEDSATISQGYPAFLGVSLSSTTGAATIAGTVTGSPAAAAGLAAGDTITAVGGTAVGTASGLSAALAAHDPGDRVRVAWTDTAGAGHTATVTLTQGPVA